jgi:hypothetical protein
VDEISVEIEKLKMKKLELTTNLKVVRDFDAKENLISQINKIQNQIKTLERFKNK